MLKVSSMEINVSQSDVSSGRLTKIIQDAFALLASDGKLHLNRIPGSELVSAFDAKVLRANLGGSGRLDSILKAWVVRDGMMTLQQLRARAVEVGGNPSKQAICGTLSSLTRNMIKAGAARAWYEYGSAPTHLLTIKPEYLSALKDAYK